VAAAKHRGKPPAQRKEPVVKFTEELKNRIKGRKTITGSWAYERYGFFACQEFDIMPRLVCSVPKIYFPCLLTLWDIRPRPDVIEVIAEKSEMEDAREAIFVRARRVIYVRSTNGSQSRLDIDKNMANLLKIWLGKQASFYVQCTFWNYR